MSPDVQAQLFSVNPQVLSISPGFQGSLRNFHSTVYNYSITQLIRGGAQFCSLRLKTYNLLSNKLLLTDFFLGVVITIPPFQK